MRIAAIFVFGLALVTVPASAHDPSAWGGSFRSRDEGATWMPIDAGLFIGGAITLAVNPVDPSDILYATDTRLLRSRNGGRDWSAEPPSIFSGPTLTVAFDGSGKVVLAATAAGVFRSEDGTPWMSIDVPASTLPARSIIAGAAPGRFYLSGARGLYRSDDYGRTWKNVGGALPDARVTAITMTRAPAEVVWIVLEGRVLASNDAAETWQPRSKGLPPGTIETLVGDPASGRLWAAEDGRLYHTEDAGMSWRAVGQPLPQPGTRVRGIAASTDATIIVVTSDRGVYRSTDEGNHWTSIEGNLPVHLESGPLVRDPNEPTTLYAGFSLTPYDEIRRRAVEGSNLLARVDPLSLAGAAAFLILLVVAAVYAVQRLSRSPRHAATNIQTTRTPPA